MGVESLLGRKKSSASTTKEQAAKALKATVVDPNQLADKLHKLNTSSASLSNGYNHDIIPKSPNGNGQASPTPIVSRTPSFNNEGQHKFTLASLLSNGGQDGRGKLIRKPSNASSQHSSNGDNHVALAPAALSRNNSQSGKKAPSEKSDKTPSLLDKYGTCERIAIGKGATAVVRLAHKWDRREEKLYAVKEFRKRRKTETEKEYVKKLTSEFCISSTLHHPNIIETVDLVQDESHHWCEVMEYCPGGDLYAAIKKGTLSKMEGEVYFKQMLLGVEYLHGMGVAHRDIKPENLLLDGRGRIKITDFGVSDVFRMCWEKKTHLSKGLCGSEPYIAPEQFEHKAEYDARLVDVWACGIVFYCMSLQELPWRLARTSDPTFSQYVQSYPTPENGLQGCPAPITNLARECRATLKHMLDPSVKNRWVVEEALKGNWLAGVDADALIKGVVTPATPPIPIS